MFDKLADTALNVPNSSFGEADSLVSRQQSTVLLDWDESGTAIESHQLNKLLEKLFVSSQSPQRDSPTLENQNHNSYHARRSKQILMSQWTRMLKGVSPLEDSVDITLAKELQAVVEVNADNEEPQLSQEFYSNSKPCLVKLEGLRKSHIGTIQLYQTGRLETATNKVKIRLPGTILAAKVFDMHKAAFVQESPMTEVHMLIKLMRGRSTHILPMLGCLATQDKFIVMFPYVKEGDMFQYLASQTERPSEDAVRNIFKNMLRGVEDCHRNLVCHRDISLENFLKMGDKLLLIDFGLSVEMNPETYQITNTGPVGKTKYMAPELALGYPYEIDGRKVDIFSLGVTLFMLITLTEPFRVALNSDERFRTLITERMLQPVLDSWGFHLSPSLVHLLQWTMEADPNRRPTVEQIYEHPWMNNI